MWPLAFTRFTHTTTRMYDLLLRISCVRYAAAAYRRAHVIYCGYLYRIYQTRLVFGHCMSFGHRYTAHKQKPDSDVGGWKMSLLPKMRTKWGERARTNLATGCFGPTVCLRCCTGQVKTAAQMCQLHEQQRPETIHYFALIHHCVDITLLSLWIIETIFSA